MELSFRQGRVNLDGWRGVDSIESSLGNRTPTHDAVVGPTSAGSHKQWPTVVLSVSFGSGRLSLCVRVPCAVSLPVTLIQHTLTAIDLLNIGLTKNRH